MSDTTHAGAITKAVLDTLTALGIGENHDPGDSEVTLDDDKQTLVIRVLLAEGDEEYAIEDGNIVATEREFEGTITVTAQVFVRVRASSEEEAESLLNDAAWSVSVDSGYIGTEDIEVLGDDIGDIEVDVR
jgi:hypothetical protein